MIIIRILVGITFWYLFAMLYKYWKDSKMNKVKIYYYKLTFFIRRIYRLINKKNTSHFVWKELINYHATKGLKFGQYEKEKQIVCSYKMNDNHSANFDYYLYDGELYFRSIILSSFDDERTHDVLLLASHFNNLINFGIVKVNMRDNSISLNYSRDLLTFSLFPKEIAHNITRHCNLTLDCFWAFDTLIKTGDDPVFVFSELMRRIEER